MAILFAMNKRKTAKNSSSINQFLKRVEQTHQQTTVTSDKLLKNLTSLRRDGRASFVKNVRDIKQTIHFLQTDLLKHFEMEDAALFPFLVTHIPRLAPIVHLLQNEHADFSENLETLGLLLEASVREDSDGKRGQLADKIEHIGTYIAYLLSNYVRNESKSICLVMKNELKPSENQKLMTKILGVNHD